MGRKALAVLISLGALALPASAQASGGPLLLYGGGPIMPSVDSVVVQWGDPSAQPAGYLSFVDKYFSDVAANSYATNDVFANDEQYQPPNGPLLTHKQTFHGEYDISPSNTSTTLSETDIGNELAAQIAAGKLPPPQAGPSTGYFVMIPADKYTVTLQGTVSGQAFCDFHYNTTYNGTPVIYAVILTWSRDTVVWSTNGSGQPVTGCGTDNNNYLNDQTENISHQQNEMITDPVNQSGWIDNSFGEIGDICISTGATNTLNGTPYLVQTEWSNQKQSCVGSVSGIQPPTASFTSAPSGLSLSLDGSGSNSPNGGIHSYAWDFGDGTGGTGPRPSHTYGSFGTYQVTLEVTDNGGFLSKTSQTIVLAAPPTSTGTGGGSGGGGAGGEPAPPTPQAIAAALTQLLVAAQGGATIPTVLAAGGFADPFTAPGPGTVIVQWYLVPPGAHVSRAKPVLVAQGQKTVMSAGRTSIKLVLTSRGRSLLQHSRSIRLTARATFTPKGGQSIKTLRAFKLRR